MCIYIYIITTCSFCILQYPLYYFTNDHLEFNNQLVCILFPRQHSFSQSQHFLPACNFLSWVDISLWAFLFNISMSISIFVHFIFKPSCWWDFTDETSDIPRRYSLTINSFIFWLLQSFWPWSWILGAEVVWKLHQLGLGFTIVHFHLLCFSVMVSICCKEKFFDEDGGLHTFVGVVINI